LFEFRFAATSIATFVAVVGYWVHIGIGGALDSKSGLAQLLGFIRPELETIRSDLVASKHFRDISDVSTYLCNLFVLFNGAIGWQFPAHVVLCFAGANST